MSRADQLAELKAQISILQKEVRRLEASHESKSGLLTVEFIQAGRGYHKHPVKNPYCLKIRTINRKAEYNSATGEFLDKVSYKEIGSFETMKDLREYLLVLGKEASGLEAAIKEEEA